MIKVVWLCNYSLHYLISEIEIMTDSSRFHTTTWIHYLIKEVIKNKSKEIDLYIITTCPYIKRKYINLKAEGISYHIIKSGIPFLSKGWPYYFRFDIFSKYYFLTKKIDNLIKKIDPDVITAHGTENVYSLPLQNSKKPSIIWIQGLMNLLITEDKSFWVQLQIKIENEVFRKNNNFISNEQSFDYIIRKQNPNANIRYLSYPISEEAYTLQTDQKEYDISFIGSLIKRKGIEDFINAVAILKKMNQEIKAIVIGHPSSIEYFNYLKCLTINLNVDKNIIFKGFIPEHLDVLKENAKSKVFLFPTHNDTGPRSVAESFAMGIPVISYRLDGLPWMIGDNERGTLVEKGDIEGLASAVNELLINSDLRVKKGAAARKFAVDNFHPSMIVNSLLLIYKDLIK